MTKNKFIASCPMPDFGFDTITLGHGSGGRLTNKLLEQSVFKLFSNEAINKQDDGAVLDIHGKTAFSTDSFVVSPIFFPGGNIGELAINGTMNDLAMCGAVPKYISLGLIIEEGLHVSDLWAVLESISAIAETYGVQVVTGDTKVVERGKGDKLFVNTSGIGVMKEGIAMGKEQIRAGDRVLVSGPLATHGMAIMSVRKGLEFETTLESDTQYIGDVSGALLDEFGQKIHFMRDPTRGGAATVLNEMIGGTGFSVELEDNSIPVLPQAASACELLGLDPLYVANEGVFITVVDKEVVENALNLMKSFDKCAKAADIGTISETYPGKVIVRSGLGGKRVVSMPIGEQLPRIC